MTDREKLKNMIRDGHDYFYNEEYKGLEVYDAIAEYLLAHGVTFAKDINILSNADKVRSMSDNKLTDFICNLHYDCCECSFESNDEVCKLAGWLKQPVKEGK